MPTHMKKKWILEIITALLIFLFLYASFSKYANFQAYRRSMHNQPFLGWFAEFLIWIIPPAEIITVIALAKERTRLWGIYIFLMLMTMFTVYIAAVLMHLFGDIPCSCGGIIQRLTWGQHLAFNIFFMLLGIIALKIQYQLIKQEKLSSKIT